ncbi:Vacuolar protein-sorting-associated protein 60 [Rhodotorula toruloides]|nr:Vacuolar protein-sorting-associated protein 60 [Rhodotorula toruloides]
MKDTVQALNEQHTSPSVVSGVVLVQEEVARGFRSSIRSHTLRMPPKRGERGRSSRGGLAQALPPVARPPGASRFAPSASYIASHSSAPPPPPVQPVAYSGYPMGSAQLGTHYPVPAGPPVVPQPPPALLHRPAPPPPPAPYASYAEPQPGPAAYSGRGPGPAFVPAPTAPPKAAWPPPQPVAYERHTYSRTPSVRPLDAAPPRPTPPPSLVPPHPATNPSAAYPPSVPPSASSAQSSRPPLVPPPVPTPFQHLSAPAIPAPVPTPATPSRPASPPPPPPTPPAANVNPAVVAPIKNVSKPSIEPAEPSPSPGIAHSVVAPQPVTDAPTVTVPAAPEATLSSSDSDSSGDSSSSSGSSDTDESDSDDDDEVAGALVGERPRSRPVEEEEEATEAGGGEAAAKATSDDSGSDSTSDSDSEKEEATAEDENAVSDLEEAVQEQVDEDDDHGQDETLPFDLGSADEADEHEDDEEDGEDVDDSLEHVAANARRKRRRLDSVGHASTVAGDDAVSDISRVTSRAVSVDPSHVHDLTLSPTRLASVPPQVSDQALHEATTHSANFSASTSTPARPVPARDSAAPPSPLADPSLLILPQKRPLEEDADDDIEEGEVVSDDDAASSTAPAYPPFHAFAGAASLASRSPFDRAASAQYDHAADASMDMDMSFVDLPADLLADPSRRAAGTISIPISSRASSAAPPAASGPASETGKASYVGKASYERKKAAPSPVDLSGGTPVPPKGGVPHPAAGKLSYKPSPLSKPADPSTASTLTAPIKAVYVRRKDASTSSAPATSAAPATTSSTAVVAAGQVKAVYERPAGSAVSAAPARPTKNKKNKARGVMPFTKEEKRERLPAKIFSAFGEFATFESASDSAIFDVPHHTVLPAKNLPPPNEAAQHGFWPGPPNRKEALKKAIFPAPPEPLEDVDDDRPRVEVFIDNSNVLYSFLNWVRARPEAKITSTKLGAQKGKDGKPQPAKTLKTVTIAGKKVKLDYKMLFALLERGRRVERRVLVGSSTLWQSLEPAVEWGYEISLLQRVPRAEPSTSASHTVAVAAQASQQQQGGKKRKQGNKKAPPPPPPPQPEASQTKHYKEQAVDELVHLKILESLLDFEPPPMPPPSPTPAPAVIAFAPSHPPVVASASDASNPPAAPEAMAVDPPPALEGTSVAETQASAAEITSADRTSTESSETVSAERSTVEPLNETADAVDPTSLVQPAGEAAEERAAESTDAEAGTGAPTTTVEAEGTAAADEDGDTSMAETQASDRVALEGDDAASTASAVVAAEPSSDSSVLRTSAPPPAPLPAPASVSSTSATTVPAKPRFVPSSAYLTGSAQPSSTPASTATSSQPKFLPAQPKITPAQPKITPAPPKIVPAAAKIVPAPPKPPAVVQFVPRRPPRDRPVLVIVTGDANSSEYNPGGFLGCVRRALDRGWDVEIAAFTHGISSLWTGEQMKRTTSDGRRRGELRVIDLALFAEELRSCSTNFVLPESVGEYLKIDRLPSLTATHSRHPLASTFACRPAMNRLFGSSSSKPKPSLADAIASTDLRVDSIEVKIRKLDAELTKYRDQLKKMRDGPGKNAVQQRALRVLKQKKLYESQIAQLQQQSFNMEQASMTTENLRNTMATVDAMKTANKEMKKQYGKIDIDEIEAMHDDMADLLDSANDVQEAMSRTYGVPEEVDEADLEAELEALGNEFEEEEGIPSYLQADATSELPDFVDEAPQKEEAPKERLAYVSPL